MKRPLQAFARNEHGNFAIMFAIMIVPLILAVGMAIDFSRGSSERAAMQNALDAAAFQVIRLADDATKADRDALLSKVYSANGGNGTAKIVQDVTVVANVASLKVAALYDMPTNLMSIVGKTVVPISIDTQVSMPTSLVAATFKPMGAHGWWDKTITLMGTKNGVEEPALRMVYTHANQTPPNGTVPSDNGTTVLQVRQSGQWVELGRIVCDDPVNPRTCTQTGGSAEVSVRQYDSIYLQMEVSASSSAGIDLLNKLKPARLVKTNDANFSDRLFVKDPSAAPNDEGVSQKKGVLIDIQKTFGCGGKGEHRWEDGGGKGGFGFTAWTGTDFAYEVTGRCDAGGIGAPILTH